MAGNSSSETRSVETMLADNGIVIWDVSSLKSAGFKKFIQTNFELIAKNPGRFVVPSFARSGLSSPKDDLPILTLSRKLFREMEDVRNYTDVFQRAKEENRKTVSLMINDLSKKGVIITIARSTGVFARMYMLSEEGVITDLPRAAKEQTSRATPAPNVTRGFTMKDRPEKIDILPIRAAGNLSVGDSVFDGEKKAYLLQKREAVHSGAVTYSTDTPGVWVKIFEGKSLNTYMEAKIRRMLSQEISFPGLCWPKSIVTDRSGTFRGYTLQAFRGTSLHLCVFKRAGLETHFPAWTRLDLCDLAETILKKIRFLHSRNILFGCINPAAIFVADKNEVYFTDTDNYQVDGFPCLTYNLSFTPPELLDKRLYFATKANENFAVAELVFMLMMPGKTPYASGSEEAPVELIRKMYFPYSVGRVSGNLALPSLWRFMWSHLESLKGSFCNVFHRNGKYSKPEDRKDAAYWESAVRHYRDYLRNPEDVESLKIYPRTFKRGNGEVFYRCRYCGEEHPRYYFADEYFEDFRICNSCLHKRSEVSFTCKACGKTFYYTNRTALFHKMKKMQDSEWKDQKYCADCKKKTLPCTSCGKEWAVHHLRNGLCPDCNQKRKNMVYTRKRCIDCGLPFEITVEEHEYLLSKGYNEPTRCKDCRARKKNGTSGSYSGTKTSSPPEKKKKGLLGWFF